jgi:phosphoribosylformylglycinamidine synthase
MGALVRACWGCYDGAKAYRTPFVSGKDSLNNQLQYTDPATGAVRVIEVPFTLLVTGLGIVHDLAHAITMDAKAPGNSLLLVGQTPGTLGGSHYHLKFGSSLAANMQAIPQTDLALGSASAMAVSSAISAGR